MTDTIHAQGSGRVALAAAGLLTIASAAAPAWAGKTELVSVGPGGVQGDSDSGLAFYVVHGYATSVTISAGGRFVAFNSTADNLVAGGVEVFNNVYVRDRKLGTTELVSHGGPHGSWSAGNPSISADGRFIAFERGREIPFKHNARNEVVVRDRLTGKTELVSVGPGGVEADGLSLNASISGKGRFVAFLSYADNLVAGATCCGGAVYVRDRLKGTTELVSVGPGGAPADGDLPSISGNGRFVAFLSFADNLVPGDTNGTHDVFVRDRKLGTTERVSVGPHGRQANGGSGGPRISPDGRFVAFWSGATNLVAGDSGGGVYVRDRTLGTTERVDLGPGGVAGDGSSGDFGLAISADGRAVAFDSDSTNLVRHDTDGFTDVFVRTR
jgi:Tol biopolymer transport system component